MERTDKVKIVLAILLVLLAARAIMHFFFQIPLEFEPYDTASESGKQQTLTATEITFVFSTSSEQGTPRYFYLIKDPDGNEGVLCAYVKYYNEVYEQPMTFTGLTYRLPEDPNPLGSIALDTDYQLQTGLSVTEIYQKLQGMAALDLSYKTRSKEHPATFWISVAASVAFLVMLAMLLKEYFGNRRGLRAKSS